MNKIKNFLKTHKKFLSNTIKRFILNMLWGVIVVGIVSKLFDTKIVFNAIVYFIAWAIGYLMELCEERKKD